MLHQIALDCGRLLVWVNLIALAADVAPPILPGCAMLIRPMAEVGMTEGQVLPDDPIAAALWAHEAVSVADMAFMGWAWTFTIATPTGDTPWGEDLVRHGINAALQREPCTAPTAEAARALYA